MSYVLAPFGVCKPEKLPKKYPNEKEAPSIMRPVVEANSTLGPHEIFLITAESGEAGPDEVQANCCTHKMRCLCTGVRINYHKQIKLYMTMDKIETEKKKELHAKKFFQQWGTFYLQFSRKN